MNGILPGETVLITGGTGSLGMALAERLVQREDLTIRIFSRDEKKQLDMRRRFPNFQYFLGSVEDPDACMAAVRDVDVVIHGASLKYVDVSEKQPRNYALVNVLGSINLIDAVMREQTVRRCVGISTDKACQPLNTYGLTKALLEKIFFEAAERAGDRIETIFTVARYGNVLGTRGSVVPYWGECRRHGVPLTVTDPDMTRFFFTLEEAIELIDVALTLPYTALVSKRMFAARLGDVADVMQTHGIKVVGRRPGEKTNEKLLTAEEMGCSVKVDDLYFVIKMPAATTMTEPVAYTSGIAPRLGPSELQLLLKEWL